MRTFYLTGAALLLGLLAHGCGVELFKPSPHKGDLASTGNSPLPELPTDQKIVRGCQMAATGPLLQEDWTVKLHTARNETAGTVIRLANLPWGDLSKYALRFSALELSDKSASLGAAQVKAWQILPMPVNANLAGYVRHTGLAAASRAMPRALLPVAATQDGLINVGALRDPADPLRPTSRLGASGEPALLWLDVEVPATAAPGSYAGAIAILKDNQPIDSVPVTLNVYDFVLPDERHLHMVGRIEWDSLEALYPDLFETITPHLMTRKDAKYATAIALLDQLVGLAQSHRTTVVVPRLQPIVKWPANQPPLVDWSDFDSLVEPWLGGGAFADKVPLGYWPLPRPGFLDRYPAALQMQYWTASAAHFAQKNWMDRGWVEVEKETPDRATASECVQLSVQAAQILGAHDKLRVTLPLEDHQLQFLNAANPALLNRADSARVMTAAQGLVYTPVQALTDWPSGIARPRHWLRTDLPGLMPYVGAGGDERDVRLWAWLAFYRQSQVIGWDGALPHSRSPKEQANPNELTWFYPGRWFGLEQPIPTIQLKWLRRAQQDYEYLHLASQRGQRLYAIIMARLMIKPVQIQPNEEPDPTYGLLSGTTDPATWNRALELLARNILLHEPGAAPDPHKKSTLDSETEMWVGPQDKPLQVPRNTLWGWSARPGNWVDLRFGLDIYNASGMPLNGELEWAGAPRGWEYNPQPVEITPSQAIETYRVRQFTMDARIDLDRLTPEMRKPIQVKFVDALRKSRRTSYLTAIVPVAASDKREGRLAIDGTLADWDEQADAIQNGPMVTMLGRPDVQKQAIQMAATSSQLFSNWAAKHFYVAFKLDGLSRSGDSTVEKNFIDYQLRRAWGEDLAEVLIQPIYANGALGQVVHIICKPNGQTVLAIKPSPANQPRQGAKYKEIAGTELRFACGVENALWRGELAIPWDAINDKDHQGARPVLMRFNFVQYKAATGESSSWAGPLDFGRDETFMGLLHLRDNKNPGMGR